MGATAFVGDWGSGKTLGLVNWLQEGVERGYETASNFGFIGETYGFTTGPELLSLVARRIRTPLRDRTIMRVAFDEARQMFSCRGQSKFPPAMEVVCDEARKLKLELAFAVPVFSRVDLNLRLATTQVVKCQGFFKRTVQHEDYGEIRSPRWVCWTPYDYADDKMGEKAGFAEWRSWKSLAPLAELYDSYFMVESVAFQLEEAAALLESGTNPDWGAAADTRTISSVDLSGLMASVGSPGAPRRRGRS